MALSCSSPDHRRSASSSCSSGADPGLVVEGGHRPGVPGGVQDLQPSAVKGTELGRRKPQRLRVTGMEHGTGCEVSLGRMLLCSAVLSTHGRIDQLAPAIVFEGQPQVLTLRFDPHDERPAFPRLDGVEVEQELQKLLDAHDCNPSPASALASGYLGQQ